MISRRTRALLLLAFVLGSVPIAAQSPLALPPGVERVTSVEGITEYRLGNGLRFLLFPDPSKQTITVNMTYLVGSRHESYGETGMAHLLEHMVFKGTPRHPNIPQELTEHGARPNGTTDVDRTNYFETFQATDENLRWALDLEADRMVHSNIARKDLESEFTVVRNEWEAGENNPFGVMLKRTMSAAFQWHNYGKSTIGERSDIENVPIERLQAFYRTFYQPDNVVLMVSGKIDESRALALVSQLFGPIPKPTRTLPSSYTVEPVQDGEHMVTVRRVGDVQSIGVIHHVPPGAHADMAPVELIGTILADTPSGRLHKAMVETKQAVFVAGILFSSYDPGADFTYAVVPKDVSLDTARETMLRTIDALATTPPTSEEVDRARTKLLTEVDLQLNSSERIGLVMSEYMAMGDWRLYFLRRDRIRTAAAEDVRRVAATYYKPANRTVGLFIPTPTPERSTVPARPDTAAMLGNYRGGEAVVNGEAFDPSPANIDARTITSATPAGLKLALVPKKTRGGTVVARLMLRFGDEKSLQTRDAVGGIVAEMLVRGTTTKTREQIQDGFDQLKSQVFVTGGAENAIATIETTRANLPAVLSLVAEVLRQPSFPADQFEQIKQDYTSLYEEERGVPQAIAHRALDRQLSPYPAGHPRYAATVDESIAELQSMSLDDVRTFYTDFYGARNGELSIVGDFDEKAMTKLAAELFGDWRPRQPFTRITTRYKEAAPVNQSLQTPDKANASIVAGMNLPIRDDDPDYPALVIGNYLLGGGFLNSRFATRIRQKDGLSYGVSSSLSANSFDRSGSFRFQAICAPQNVAKVEVAFREELVRALRDGFTADEIKAAKSGWLQSRQVSRAQDRTAATQLGNQLFTGRTMAWEAQLEQKIQALNPEQIVTALRKYLDPQKVVIIKAGDFQKIKSS